MPLPRLRDKQLEVLYLPAKGHVVVLGTAGSGKTTLAVHRALHLCDSKTTHFGPTLLLTYNNSLLPYLNYLLDGFPLANLTVENYHKFARGYLHSRGKMQNNAICEGTSRSELIAESIASEFQESGDPFFANNPQAYFENELEFIAGHGIGTLDEYLGYPRLGREDWELSDTEKTRVFGVLTRYRELREGLGYVCDWSDIGRLVIQELGIDDEIRRYSHIVVDEGQDFSPVMLRSLVAALPNAGSLTYFGDAAQQIFGNHFTWRSAGLDTEFPYLFDRNYRNTREIYRFAKAITEMEYFRGVVDLVEPLPPVAEGALPALVAFPNVASEVRYISEMAADQSRTQSVAVLAKTRSELRLLKGVSHGATKLNRNLRVWTNLPGLYVGTIHAAKGLEFDTVILPFVSASNFPDADQIERVGQANAEARDGRLLYVGASRARFRLVMTHSVDRSLLIPERDELFLEVGP